MKQARTLRGVLVQARVAFEFSVEQLNKFGGLMKPITECIRKAEMEGEDSWCSECKEGTIKFKERLVDQRRHYTNPDRVESGGVYTPKDYTP